MEGNSSNVIPEPGRRKERKPRHKKSKKSQTSSITNARSANAKSIESTPRKRRKCRWKERHQQVRDFVPDGANFSNNMMAASLCGDDGTQDSPDHAVLVTPKSPLGQDQSDHLKETQPVPEGVAEIYHDNTDSDGGLVLHTYSNINKLSEGEPDHSQTAENINTGIANTDIAVKEEVQDGAYGATEDQYVESDSEPDTESDQGDAMMDYANAEQNSSNGGHRPKVMILAELSPQDLNAQLRYFHVTKVASSIDLNTPVRCLVCGMNGHATKSCPLLTCDGCGKFNLHTTQDCPSISKCSKCREIGHDQPRCPYKLKHVDQKEIVCDSCQRNGHVETDCELKWRTSGRPWEVDLTKTNVRLSCYECGRSGHLGNDCPTRRPGKSFGTSTWGTGEIQLSIKSKDDLKIKGSARQNPIDIDGEDGGSFVRPRVPEPVRKGKIQIKGLGANSSPYNGWNPLNAPRHNDRVSQNPQSSYRDIDRSNWRDASDRGRPSQNDSNRHDGYQPANRRSRSPTYPGYGSSDRYGRYPPPPPVPTSWQPWNLPHQSPTPAGPRYQPMPSAAQNAWSTFRR